MAYLPNQPNTATATLSNVNAATSSTTLLAANSSRLQFLIYNDSNSILYLKFGSNASQTSYTVEIPGNTLYEPQVPLYTGIITGIWQTTNGAARVTELTL